MGCLVDRPKERYCAKRRPIKDSTYLMEQYLKFAKLQNFEDEVTGLACCCGGTLDNGHTCGELAASRYCQYCEKIHRSKAHECMEFYKHENKALKERVDNLEAEKNSLELENNGYAQDFDEINTRYHDQQRILQNLKRKCKDLEARLADPDYQPKKKCKRGLQPETPACSSSPLPQVVVDLEQPTVSE